MTSALAGPVRPPQADRITPGLVLALLAHAVLIGLVVLNVDFHTDVTATPAEAELWSTTPQLAAPRPMDTPPPPEPPRPAPVPQPKAVEPDPAVQRRDAEIAVEQEKKQERLRRERELQQQQAAEKQRQLEQQRRAEDAAERKRLEAAKAKALQDKQRTARAEPPQDDKARAAQLKRILGEAGATGDAGATGTAQRSAGFSASYAGRIAGRIKPNVVFPDSLPGNPAVEVELRMSADGHIVSRRVTKQSGAPDWDQAVLRAIDKTDMLPPDTDGRVPSTITLVYHPKDLGG